MERSLNELESSILQVVERIQSTESANAALRREISRLRKSLEELEEENRELRGEVGRHRRDRSEIRERLLRLRRCLEVLRRPIPSVGESRPVDEA